MKIYDITAEISSNLPVFGDERPTVDQVLQLAKGDPYNFTKVAFTAHTGTHADMPSHFIQDGATCDNIPLEHFYGKAKVIRIPATSHITKADLLPYDIAAGDILLIDTGQSKHMQEGTLKKDFIALIPDAAQYLVEKKVKTVGIDYLSVDPYDAADFPVHMALLGNGITILEGLVLENVPEGEYILSALPLKIAGGDGSPVRAVLISE
ncbi:MAG: cyclase family protein [Defluviitaleaceae bacterium]|nr:cyclase family protein [Defluviitaleaceae bacterium]